MHTIRKVLFSSLLIIICLCVTKATSAQTLSFEELRARDVANGRMTFTGQESSSRTISLPSATGIASAPVLPATSSGISEQSGQTFSTFVGFFEGGIVEGTICECGEIVPVGDEGINLKPFAFALAGIAPLALLGFQDSDLITQIGNVIPDQGPIAPIPEPATLLLLGISLAATVAAARRRRAIFTSGEDTKVCIKNRP